MIRRSAFVAVACLLVSLVIHVFSIGVSVRVSPDAGQEGGTEETVAMGTAFEDLAESVTEPVVPEPPAETPPPPEPADIPTSQALVASPDPQATTSPGTGPAAGSQAEPLAPAGAPPTVEPVSSDPQPAAASPVEPSETPPSAQAADSPDTDPSEAAPAPVAAAELPTAAVPPVTPAPDPAAIPVIASALAPVEPAVPERILEAVPQSEGAEPGPGSPAGTELAVRSSPRPPARSSRSVDPSGDPDGDGPPPLQMAESPLVAYARDGNLSGWAGRDGSGGSGNASVTNYAGRVLVHLNNAPRVPKTGRGAARVIFVINPDGTLASVDVVQSSGTFELDNAAKAQVRLAAPFPRPPEGRSRRLSFIYRSR